MIRKPTLKAVEYTNWSSKLITPIKERPNFQLDDESVHYERIGARILGADFDETDYLIDLYRTGQSKSVYVLSENLDKTITPERFQSMQKIYELIREQPNLSINRFVAFLEGAQLLPKYMDDLDFNRLIRESLIVVLKKFQDSHGGRLNHSDFRRLFLDIIKWTWNHIDPWVRDVPITEDVPHVVWYGKLNKSQSYFLYYLLLLGMDVVILQTDGTDDFKEIDPSNEVSTVVKYPSTIALQPFPTEEPQRQGTVAYRASKEIDSVLHHEGSAFYKPWQFRDHAPISVTLKTTYDELFLVAKEKAFIRPNFSASTTEVKIPSLFAKISGVSSTRKEFWDKLHGLTSNPNAFTVKQFPYAKEQKSNNQFHYSHAIGRDGRLEPEKMITSNWWQYSQLREGLQVGIAAAISRACVHPKLKPQPGESMEQVSLYIFTQAIHIPEPLLNLMQTFDYSQDVPKLILYNNEQNGTLSRADATLLLVLNEIGFDIVLYNPPGHNDLEPYIATEVFDHHLLEDMVFDLAFQEHKKDSSIMGNLFNHFFSGKD